MVKKLPKGLGKEPIIDAIFECRFDSESSVSNILPGIFYSQLDDEKASIEALPQAEIPAIIRNNDPNMQYLPLVRIRLKDYMLLIGDRSLAIASNLPYRGWHSFKEIIIRAIEILESSGLVKTISRYSLKYVDLIPKNLVKPVNLNLSIGSSTLVDEAYQVRMDIKKDEFINIIQIISDVHVTTTDGEEKKGIAIDIDTIKQIHDISLSEIKENLNDKLDKIHDVSKEIFFDCLTEEMLEYLEPSYHE